MELEVETILKSRGVWYRIIELSDKAMTVADVIRFARGSVNPDEICETVVIKLRDNGFAGALLRGTDRLDNRKAEALFGKKFRFATPEEVPEAAHAVPGAVCPVLLDIPLYIDHRVLELQQVNLGSGDLRHGLELKVAEFDKILHYEVVDLIKDN